MQIGFRQFVCVGIRKGFIRKADADELALGHHRLAYGASPFQDHGLASSMQDGFSQRPGNVIGHAIIVHSMYKKMYIECTKKCTCGVQRRLPELPGRRLCTHGHV